MLEGGYGLPQTSEWQRLEAESSSRQLKLRGLTDDLDRELHQLIDPRILAELDAVQLNLDQLSAHLRQLHKDAGGIELP